MIFLARLLFRDFGKNINKHEVVFKVGISTMSVLFAALHVYFCICCAIYGLYSLIPFSVCAIALYIAIVFMNQKKVSGASGAIFVLIPIVYAIACAYMAGWDFGAQWYLLALVGPVYLIYEEYSAAMRRLCLILLIISMIFISYVALFNANFPVQARQYLVLEVSNVFLAILVSVMAAEVIHFSNVLSQRRSKSKLATLTDEADRDPLTSMWNRRHIENTLINLFWDDTVNRGRTFVASIDIDHFQRINDEYGQEAGDDILKKFAKVMTNSFRGTDVVARWDGEAFIAVLNDTDDTGALRALENFKNKLKDSDIAINERKIDINVTIGFVSCNVDDTYKECIARSAAALTHGKESGCDVIVNYRDVPGAKSY